MEQELLNQFYSTQHTFNMTRLTNTKQLKDELVLDYINYWHVLNLECKGWLFDPSIVEMCTQ